MTPGRPPGGPPLPVGGCRPPNPRGAWGLGFGSPATVTQPAVGDHPRALPVSLPVLSGTSGQKQRRGTNASRGPTQLAGPSPAMSNPPNTFSICSPILLQCRRPPWVHTSGSCSSTTPHTGAPRPSRCGQLTRGSEGVYVQGCLQKTKSANRFVSRVQCPFQMLYLPQEMASISVGASLGWGSVRIVDSRTFSGQT
jgi:hypothetical protein